MNTLEDLHLRISELASKEVGLDENLLNGVIDSLAWVGLINLVEDFAIKKGAIVDLESLLVSKVVTIRDIAALLERKK